jgi:hypothetical protein
MNNSHNFNFAAFIKAMILASSAYVWFGFLIFLRSSEKIYICQTNWLLKIKDKNMELKGQKSGAFSQKYPNSHINCK